MQSSNYKTLALNCDLGESFGAWSMGNDQAIMPYIDQANIACGFHAGDPLVMQKTVALAVAHKVSIGAHPSYPDLQGFGRRSIQMQSDELIACLHYQLGALSGVCHAQGRQLDYIKPHGALYNDMMKNIELFEVICQAIQSFKQTQTLVIQALPEPQVFLTIAKQYGVSLRFEVFADRNYLDNGLLVPRSEQNAVIHNPELVVERLKQLASTGTLFSVDGKTLSLTADTVCVHSDTPDALALVKLLSNSLKNV
ncbi:5-oxoprolinase subunit PxpA [Colwellia sp. MEBiC06753]